MFKIDVLTRVLAGVLIVAQAQAAMPVGAFKITPGDSKVEFVMRDNRGGFTGTTDKVEGTVTVRKGDGDAFEAAVDAKIDARTLVTGSGQRDGQMRRDFLQTDRHPFITFRGTVIANQMALRGSARMRGVLTIKDVTRDVDMPFDVTVSADEYRAAGEVVLKLSDYGIPIPRFLIFRAEDPVTVKLQIRVHR
jgi:polyisoprenoid-binding protein YceI